MPNDPTAKKGRIRTPVFVENSQRGKESHFLGTGVLFNRAHHKRQIHIHKYRVTAIDIYRMPASTLPHRLGDNLSVPRCGTYFSPFLPMWWGDAAHRYPEVADLGPDRCNKYGEIKYRWVVVAPKKVLLCHLTGKWPV